MKKDKLFEGRVARGKHFYSAMQEKRRQPTTLIKDGKEFEFASKQEAGIYLSGVTGRTIEHCTLMLRKFGVFYGYSVKKDESGTDK